MIFCCHYCSYECLSVSLCACMCACECMCISVRVKCIADKDVGKMVLPLRIGDPHLAQESSRYTNKTNGTRKHTRIRKNFEMARKRTFYSMEWV